MHNTKKIKRFMCFLLMIFCFITFNVTTYAQETKDLEANIVTQSDADVMSLEGPTVYVDLGEYGCGELTRDSNGNYSGSLTPKSGITSFTCIMTGYINGISNYYEIGIKWSGSNKVNYISADSLTVKSTSILNSDVYWTNPFYISAGSTTLGYRAIGYTVVPPDVTKVYVVTSGLKAFFNNEDYWYKYSEISGTINLK